ILDRSLALAVAGEAYPRLAESSEEYQIRVGSVLWLGAIFVNRIQGVAGLGPEIEAPVRVGLCPRDVKPAWADREVVAGEAGAVGRPSPAVQGEQHERPKLDVGLVEHLPNAGRFDQFDPAVLPSAAERSLVRPLKPLAVLHRTGNVIEVKGEVEDGPDPD